MYTFTLNSDLYVDEQTDGHVKMAGDSLVLVPGSGFLGQDRVQVILPYFDDTTQGNNASPKKYLAGTFTHGMYIWDGKSFTPFKTEIDSLIRQYMLNKGILINRNYAHSVLGFGLVIINPPGKLLQQLSRSTDGLSSTNVF